MESKDLYLQEERGQVCEGSAIHSLHLIPFMSSSPPQDNFSEFAENLKVAMVAWEPCWIFVLVEFLQTFLAL